MLLVDEIVKWVIIWEKDILLVKQKNFMSNDTVEGEQLVREIGLFILRKINKKKIPLMIKLVKAILNNKKLVLK